MLAVSRWHGQKQQQWIQFVLWLDSWSEDSVLLSVNTWWWWRLVYNMFPWKPFLLSLNTTGMVTRSAYCKQHCACIYIFFFFLINLLENIDTCVSQFFGQLFILTLVMFTTANTIKLIWFMGDFELGWLWVCTDYCINSKDVCVGVCMQ